MNFTTPWLLAALLGLPILWWLLRAVPPPPRRQPFPAIRLLYGLVAHDTTTERTPWWLLLLRAGVAALFIVGMAAPVLHVAPPAPHHGPMRLVIDDGWVSAPDWSARMQAARVALDQAAQAEEKVSLLTTAADDTAEPPAPTAFLPASAILTRINGLKPKPYAPDRAAAATALEKQPPATAWTLYIADGVAEEGDDAFQTALKNSGPVEEERAETPHAETITGIDMRGHSLTAHISLLPSPHATRLSLLAQTTHQTSLAEIRADVPANTDKATLSLNLPTDLRTQVAQLVVQTPLNLQGLDTPGPGAGNSYLLDSSTQIHPVGLVNGGQGADLPLTGALYYVRQALQPGADISEGDVKTLLTHKLSAIVDANPQMSAADAALLKPWLEKGGWLIRFAGSEMDPNDPLLPVALASGSRLLGGAMSWGQPAHLAPFPAASPFAGLTPPADVTVSQQVMAQPAPDLPSHSWATLTDGTPLVTWSTVGQGRLILFHITAAPAWSSLPLSGLFPQMMRRLLASSGGVASQANAAPRQTPLAPIETMNGYGLLAPPPAGVTALPPDQLGVASASPRHPPGFYGRADQRYALNIGPHAGPLTPERPVGAIISLNRIEADHPLIGWFLLAGLFLLLADWLIGMRLRGLLFAVSLLLLPAISQAATPDAALHMRLAWVASGDSSVDAEALAGLHNLSAYLTAHTSVSLTEPQSVTPGVDDLSFYPMLYWPVSGSDRLSPQAIEALNHYMAIGGLLVIDTRNGGGDDGGASALRRFDGLAVPALTKLTPDHVLTHSFYLIEDCSGRYNTPVWLARPAEGGGDQVSPVVISGNDWAGAWAAGGGMLQQDVGPTFGYGQALNDNYNVDPNTKLAFHCGVNLMMYALTGTYKADQTHVQRLLDRMGH